MKKMVWIIILSLFTMLYGVTVGKKPISITISSKDGGTLDNQEWQTSSMNGKITAFFYVDPDFKDLNDDLGVKLTDANLDKSKFQAIAVINLAASWIPSIFIEVYLEQKQKQFPDVIYIKDLHKVFVNKWKLEDDNSDVIVLDKNGKCIYKYFGKLPNHEQDKVITLIKKNI